MTVPVAAPILAGFQPDPSVVPVDSVDHPATSTFEYLPGLPVHRITRPEHGPVGLAGPT